MNSKFKNYEKLHIDIGANEGNFSVHYANHQPNTFFVAFEPIPTLIQRMKSKATHLNNIEFVEAAISNYEGNDILKISPPSSQYGDYACSSLLEFSDKSKTDWPGRQDFQVVDSIPVTVRRLDNFIIENEIEKIDYLKIDTQGHDLNVLYGCGQFLSIIREGEMEAAAKKDILYNGQNTQEDCIKFLEQNNFEIVAIHSNDIFTNEVNIIFKNKSPKTALYQKSWKIN